MISNDIELDKEAFGEGYNEMYAPYLGAYRFEQWTFGDREDVIEQSAEQVKTSKGDFDMVMKSSKFRVLTISKCLKEAPFKINYKTIRSVPVVLGEWLYEKSAEVNGAMGEGEFKIKK